MFCKTRTKWESKIVSARNYCNVFVSLGSINWQRSAIKEHEASAPHVAAIDLKQCFDRMPKEDRKMFVRSFKIAYLLTKKGKTLLRFSRLVRNGSKAWC